MNLLIEYVRLLLEQEQLAIPFPETLKAAEEEEKAEKLRLKKEKEEKIKAAEKEKLVTAFMDDPSHGLHLAEMMESEIAEDFHEIKENILLLIELVEDKTNLMPWGGYNYPAQSGINRTGELIIDDLIHIGIDDENEIFQLVKSVYMGCTNKAKGTYCIENTEALKDWVGAA